MTKKINPISYKAGLNKSDAPEAEDFICFHGIGGNNYWVNAEKVTRGDGLQVVFVDSFCGECVEFGPSDVRKFAFKLLKWAGEMENSNEIR